MSKIIGARRIIVLLGLLALNAVLAAGIYMFFMPGNESLQSELNQVQSKVSAARSNTDQMKNQFDLVQKQKSQFEQLQATEFLATQDRVQARDRITSIQRYSKVLSASYEISPAVQEKSESLTAAGQVMLSTPIALNIEALDDMDFYNFLYLMRTAFPGHISIDNIDMKRVNELNDVTLRQIGSGTPVSMVSGAVSLTWKTIVPEKQAEAVAAAQQSGM